MIKAKWRRFDYVLATLGTVPFFVNTLCNKVPGDLSEKRRKRSLYKLYIYISRHILTRKDI